MATTLDIPAGGLSLRGWPAQPYKYSSKESTSKRTAVLLQVNKRVIQDLQQCARNGEVMKLLGGRIPKLQYGSKALSLNVEPEAYTHELYRSESGGLSYVASVSHRASISAPNKASQTTAGTDAALANLKQSLASFAHDKEAKSALLSSSVIPTTKSTKVLSNRYMSDVRHVSQGSSPMHTGSKTGLAPTSAPVADNNAAAQTKAMTFALSHLLAPRPLSDEQIAKQTHIPQPKRSELLMKVAEQDRSSSEWRLKDKTYKDVDVWKFKYNNDEDREAAIDNAIRALDRLRLSKDDKIWQQLLPLKERGKGKCLSRLHNNIHLAATTGPSHLGAASPPFTDNEGRLTPLAATPMVRSGSANGKSLTIEKRLKESQKARAAEEAKAKKAAAASPKVSTGKTSTPKSTTKTPSKFKSAETVHSSDDSSSEMGLITGKQRNTLMSVKKPEGRMSPSSSSGETKIRVPAKRAAPAKTQVSPEKAVKSVSAKDGASSNAPKPAQAAARKPVESSKIDPRPLTANGINTKVKKPSPTGTPDIFGGQASSQPVVRKVVGGKTPVPATAPTTSPSYSAPHKPKNTSPLARGAGNTPTLFGGYDKAAPVAKKVVASDKPASKAASAPAAGTPDASKKRPASTTDDDRARKVAKTSPAPAPASLKRRSDTSDDVPATKHRRTESSSTQSVGTYSSSSGNSHTTTARTSVASPSPSRHDDWARSPSANSSLSEGGKTSWERALNDAERWRTTLWPKYQQLYDKLAAMREEDVLREEREELWRLHMEMKEVKSFIKNAASA